MKTSYTQPSVRYIGALIGIALMISGTGFADAQESNAISTDLYVSPMGKASATGTKEDPFNSLESARQFIRTLKGEGNIVVSLSGGNYPMTETMVFGPEDSGNPSRKIIYRAALGEMPVMKGLIRISGWQLQDATRNIWKASVKPGLEFREFYVNGQKARLSRSTDRMGLTVSPQGFSSKDPHLLSLGGSHSLNSLEVVTRPQLWIQDVLPVAAISGNGDISLRAACWNIVKSRPYPSRKNPVWLQNAYEFLRDSGDWYLDREKGLVFYIPRRGEVPETMIAEAPGLDRLIAIRGDTNHPVSNLSFLGLSFTGATCRLDHDLGLPQIQSNQPEDLDLNPKTGETWQMNGAVEISYAENIDIAGCTFRNIGGNALQILKGSRSIVVDRCNFHGLGGTAVQVGIGDKRAASISATSHDFISDIVVANCTIDSVGSDYPSGCGIFVGYAARCLIYHNLLHELPYTGISLGWGWGAPADGNQWNLIEGNHIHHHMRVLADGGGIYCNGRQNHATLARNYVHDQGNLYGSIYLDDGSSNWSVFENVATKDRAEEWLLYKGSGNECFGNWSDNPKVRPMTTGPLPSICTNNMLCMKRAWTPEAKVVMEEAGPLPGIAFTSDPSSLILDWRASSVASSPQICKSPDRSAAKGTEYVPLKRNAPLQKTVMLKQGHRYLLDCGVASLEEGRSSVMGIELSSQHGKSTPSRDVTTASIAGLFSRQTRLFSVGENGLHPLRISISPRSLSATGALAFLTLRDVTP